MGDYVDPAKILTARRRKEFEPIIVMRGLWSSEQQPISEPLQHGEFIYITREAMDRAGIETTDAGAEVTLCGYTFRLIEQHYHVDCWLAEVMQALP